LDGNISVQWPNGSTEQGMPFGTDVDLY